MVGCVNDDCEMMNKKVMDSRDTYIDACGLSPRHCDRTLSPGRCRRPDCAFVERMGLPQ